MNNQAGFGVRMGAQLTAHPGLISKMLLGSVWDFECFDKFGNLKWEERARPNIIPNEGLNGALDILFHGSTQITTWYIAIFESNTTPLSTHTYASPGYTESTAYDEAN